MLIRPYTIDIDDAALGDLAARLRTVRWPSSLDHASWDDGASLSFMRRLISHWRDGFHWRAQEARLNRLPNYMASVDGLDIHFVHQRGNGPAPMPLILTHGWPGSFVEFEHLIPLLTDPQAHGGEAADAFDVVVPSLPGYGFSTAPTQPGTGPREIAMLWKSLMEGLGYHKFGVQGGDIGAGISVWLARQFPEAVEGMHLNYIPGGFRPELTPSNPITFEEQAFLDNAAAWSAREGAYAALHGTKPLTLAYALADSPVGLAAWIAEKFRSWSDNDGDLESAILLDALLTDISLYWFAEDRTAALRLYKEGRALPLVFQAGERVTVPLGMAHFPRELPTPPRSWVERVFDVRHWTSMPSGGHFAALERPELLAADIRNFFRPLR